MPDAEFAIQLHGISVTLGAAPIIKDLSLDVVAGSSVALLGPSGCGKTTLLRVVTRGVGMVGVSQVRGKIGVVYQDLKLLPWMDVLSNVTMGLPNKESATSAARELLETAGIADKANAYPYQLSGGQKQRVAIARALAAGADILLLDEPFSALDFVARGRLLSLIQGIHRKAKITIIVVTHSIEDALALAERLLVMRDGRIVGDFCIDAQAPEAVQRVRASILDLYGG